MSAQDPVFVNRPNETMTAGVGCEVVQGRMSFKRMPKGQSGRPWISRGATQSIEKKAEHERQRSR